MTEREMALRGRAPAAHQPPVNNRYFSRKWGVLYDGVYMTIANTICTPIWWPISNLILSIAMGQTALRIRNDITKAND